MTLQEKINTDIKSALKAHDLDKLSILRGLMSAIKNQAIELKKDALDDAEVVKVLSKEAKKTKDSLQEFKKGERDDLAAKAQKEIEITEIYLPKEISDAELEKIVTSAIKTSDAKVPADMGKAMRVSMTAVAGRADGGRVSALVKKYLLQK